MVNNKAKTIMKKTLLLALAVLVTSMSMAQLKSETRVRDLSQNAGAKDGIVWEQIGNPFTATDINGNTISLQSYLDSGFCVVIDYFACWCGPCWNVHQAGILDQIWETYGPEGNNTMRVLQIETEDNNTAAQLTGTSGSGYSQTAGNWVAGVPYPTIDASAPLNTCSSLYDGYIPFIVFITPEGYYAAIYGEDWGIPYPLNVAASVANMATLRNNRPQPGVAPVISINGPEKVLKGNEATFTANIVSVDQVTDITWTIEGQNYNTQTVSHTFNTTGNFTVSLSVTNTTGTTNANFTVNVFEWNWGETMYYCDDANEGALGLSAGGAITWGVQFPASAMTGRQYAKSVDIFTHATGSYNVKLYQGGANAPETQIYSRTFNVSTADAWYSMNVSGSVSLDQTKNLWVIITANGYAATYSEYCGDDNSNWINLQNTWYHLDDVYDGNGSWMIKFTSGNSGNVGINSVDGSNINVFPNPTTGKVNIDAEGLNRIEVLDMTGRTVLTSNASTVDMSNLNNGVYMFRVVTENGTSLKKVVKR